MPTATGPSLRRTQPNDRPGGPGEPPMTRHSLTFGNKEPDARLQRRPEQRPGYTKIKSADHFFTLSDICCQYITIQENVQLQFCYNAPV